MLIDEYIPRRDRNIFFFNNYYFYQLHFPEAAVVGNKLSPEQCLNLPQSIILSA
jgi:hypothetical protein